MSNKKFHWEWAFLIFIHNNQVNNFEIINFDPPPPPPPQIYNGPSSNFMEKFIGLQNIKSVKLEISNLKIYVISSFITHLCCHPIKLIKQITSLIILHFVLLRTIYQATSKLLHLGKNNTYITLTNFSTKYFVMCCKWYKIVILCLCTCM